MRVLVNQAHTFGNGGSFNNALNFTLSMGCGTWGGNSISENLNYRHFINITHLVKAVIGEDKPSEDESVRRLLCAKLRERLMMETVRECIEATCRCHTRSNHS